MRSTLISTKPFVLNCSWLASRCSQRSPFHQRFPWALQLKEQILKSKSRTIASFSRCRFVRVLLVAVVFCLRMTDTIVVFSVWAFSTLKLRSWMIHAPVVGVWTWHRCDLAFPFWKDWHPLPPPVLVSLGAEDHRLALWEIWGLQ